MGSGFLKRLAWYLVGFSIGLIFLVFIVKKKSGENGIEICYFPNCRVLKDIRSKPFLYQNQDTLKFDELAEEIRSLLQDGSIDFGQSDTKSEPCKTYHIEYQVNGKMTVAKIKNCPEIAEVIGLKTSSN